MKRLGTGSLLIVLLTSLLLAQSATVRIDGDRLRIAAPRLHFLVGEALNRLRDGATVKYEFQLTARTDRTGRVLARSLDQFAVSYDLWEEKFAIKKLGPSPITVSHLSAAAAEAWCLDNTSLSISSLGGSPLFWIRLDYQAAASTETTEQSDNSGFTLTGLIDIFSRRTRSEQVHGSEEVGPLRLESLKKK